MLSPQAVCSFVWSISQKQNQPESAHVDSEDHIFVLGSNVQTKRNHRHVNAAYRIVPQLDPLVNKISNTSKDYQIPPTWSLLVFEANFQHTKKNRKKKQWGPQMWSLETTNPHLQPPQSQTIVIL